MNKNVANYTTFIKESHELNSLYNLMVVFTDLEEYYKAVDFFKSKSDFHASDYNSEFKTIFVSCDSQEDMDTTEKDINSELMKNNFDNYYFESE